MISQKIGPISPCSGLPIFLSSCFILSLSFVACGPSEHGSDAGTSSAANTAHASTSNAASALGSPSAPLSASAAASAAQAPAAPARPLYYEGAIADSDLAGRTLRELTLLRNTIYARAGNSFRKPWLDAYFRAQPWYAPAAKMDETKISEVDKTNARKIADADAAITKESLEKRRDEVLARQKAGTLTAEDKVELSLLSQRLGTWLGEGQSEVNPSPLEDPSRLDKLLHVDELSTLSRRDLRILRNTIYARRGRQFDSAVVKSYFKGATWYRPINEYNDGLLNEIDRKNIAIVRSIEKSLGGPEHENPDYGKDDRWFWQA